MADRYCTMPKIPWFRDWFESKFGDLCEKHDTQYRHISAIDEPVVFKKRFKHESDFGFALSVALRGYVALAILALIFFQLPWVGPKIK